LKPPPKYTASRSKLTRKRLPPIKPLTLNLHRVRYCAVYAVKVLVLVVKPLRELAELSMHRVRYCAVYAVKVLVLVVKPLRELAELSLGFGVVFCPALSPKLFMSY
jgi:hypothetical protein